MVSGFVRRIMRLIKSWARRSLIARGGKRGGGRDGRMGGVIEMGSSVMRDGTILPATGYDLWQKASQLFIIWL